MPFIRVWIHLVWSTKNREKLITPQLKKTLLEHITENAKKKNIWLSNINCVADHIHLLISLGSGQTISKIAMLIKGESSFWINKNSLCKTKFEWQDEYYAVSVSESNIKTLREYIHAQEEHHQAKSFSEEYDGFMKNEANVFLSNECG